VKVPTDGYTDTLTDRRNRFYTLSHAICYSYETDKDGNYDALQLEGRPMSRQSFWAFLAKSVVCMHRTAIS